MKWASSFADGAEVLLCQRPANAGRWQNMWEVLTRAKLGEDVSEAAARVAKGTDWPGRGGPRGGVDDQARRDTRMRSRSCAWKQELTGGEFAPGAYAAAKVAEPAELAEYPVSSPQRKRS